jgi:hypothetical protein
MTGEDEMTGDNAIGRAARHGDGQEPFRCPSSRTAIVVISETMI